MSICGCHMHSFFCYSSHLQQHHAQLLTSTSKIRSGVVTFVKGPLCWSSSTTHLFPPWQMQWSSKNFKSRLRKSGNVKYDLAFHKQSAKLEELLSHSHTLPLTEQLYYQLKDFTKLNFCGLRQICTKKYAKIMHLKY